MKERTTARIERATRTSHHEMRRIFQYLSCTPSPPYPSLQIHQFSIHKPTPSHPEEELPRVGAQQNHPVTPFTTPSDFSARVIECIQHLRMQTSDKYIIHTTVLAWKRGRAWFSHWLAPHRLVSSTILCIIPDGELGPGAKPRLAV